MPLIITVYCIFVDPNRITTCYLPPHSLAALESPFSFNPNTCFLYLLHLYLNKMKRKAPQTNIIFSEMSKIWRKLPTWKVNVHMVWKYINPGEIFLTKPVRQYCEPYMYYGRSPFRKGLPGRSWLILESPLKGHKCYNFVTTMFEQHTHNWDCSWCSSSSNMRESRRSSCCATPKYKPVSCQPVISIYMNFLENLQ